MMTDVELISKILDGDENLLKNLIDRYKDQVLKICYGLTQNQSDAEDVTQEVFIEVYQSLSTFRNESKFSTWIYRISINKSLNFIRKQKRLKIFNSIEELFTGKNVNRIEQADSSRLPDDFSDPEHETKQLKAAISMLPEPQKIALSLFTYQELSYKQIAEVMNVSLASVESLIFRSKKNLRKILVENLKKPE